MRVEVRRARQSDKGPLMAFIKDVWGGHDYIPRVWDRWLGEKDARMFVVLADGRQVGMSRVRFLSDGSAWFEGARVHPGYRGMGLATALGEAGVDYARRKGASVFRLTSNSRNRQAHRQIARIGFEESHRISVYELPDGLKPRAAKDARPAGPGDAERVLEAVEGSRELALSSGLLWDSFTAVRLTRESLAMMISGGHVYRLGGAVAVSKLGGEGTESWNQVCFLTGPSEDAVRLVLHIFAQKRVGRVDWCMAYIPQGSELISGLRGAGLKRSFSLILFERQADNG